MTDRHGHFSEIERETLRNEQLEHETHQLRAEVERLKIVRDALLKDMQHPSYEVENRLRAEFERLQSALQAIKRHQEYIGGPMAKHGMAWAIADRALRGEGE
jgi:hypothetical protein